MSNLFDQFAGQAFLNLETFRKSGEGVKTPVWFLQEGEVLYVRTLEGSGKVKRIRRDDRVRVVPCQVQGEAVGEWVDGRAHLVDEAEIERVSALMTEKYGEAKKKIDRERAANHQVYATIAIHPVG